MTTEQNLTEEQLIALREEGLEALKEDAGNSTLDDNSRKFHIVDRHNGKATPNKFYPLMSDPAFLRQALTDILI